MTDSGRPSDRGCGADATPLGEPRPLVLRILALHTTGPGCSVALADGAHVRVRSHARASEALPGLVAQVLLARGLTLAGLDAVAAARGPGSFTGIKIGLATAWGLARAGGTRAVGVGSLDAIAAACGATGRVMALARAYGPWVYAGLFEVEAGEPPALSAEYRVSRLDEVLASIPAGVVVARHAVGASGTWAEAARDVTGDEVARAVAAIAARRIALGSAGPASPLYLRADPTRAW